RRACVVASEEATVLVLDQCVDPLPIRPGCDPDAPDRACRHARVAGDLGPGLTAVGALEQPAAGAAARHLVFLPVGLPERGVHHLRVRAVDAHVDRSGPVVAEQHATPALAAVGAFVEATLAARHAVLAE